MRWMLHELIRSPGVREEVKLRGAVGVMALHGGLEAGTAEAAREVATATGASLYSVVQPDDLAWHIPSIRYNPSHSHRLCQFLDHIAVAVSFHGFGRKELKETILVGGRNLRLATAIGEAIIHRSSLHVITDPGSMPRGLTGMHPKNPVNLPKDGGVQLEMSAGARSPHHLSAVIVAVATVIVGEMASADRGGRLEA